MTIEPHHALYFIGGIILGWVIVTLLIKYWYD